jgi:hypothetical protein
VVAAVSRSLRFARDDVDGLLDTCRYNCLAQCSRCSPNLLASSITSRGAERRSSPDVPSTRPSRRPDRDSSGGESEATRRVRRPRWSASCDRKVGGAHPGARAARQTRRSSGKRAAGKPPKRPRRSSSSPTGSSTPTRVGVRGYGSGGRRGGGSRKALRQAFGDSDCSARLERSEPSSSADLVWRAAPAAAPSGTVANAGPRPATAQLQLPQRKRRPKTSDRSATQRAPRRPAAAPPAPCRARAAPPA